MVNSAVHRAPVPQWPSKPERPDLFMNAAKEKNEDERSRAQAAAARPLDPGETRAVILAAVALAVFLYFIKLILLPFVLAAIVAYISTKPLDWIAKRTGWPRVLFAVLLFLVFLVIGALFSVFAAKRIAVETLGLAADLQQILQSFIGQVIGDHPVQLLGRSITAQQIVNSALDQIRDWIGQTDQLALLTGYGLAAVMGAFLTVVLLFYFLTTGKRIARGLLWIVPPHRRPLVQRIWKRLDPVLTRYFLGMIVVVIYATTAAYVGLGFILGIDHAVLLALLTGILETVPVVGSTSAAIIAGLISLRTATGLMSILDYALYATALRLSIDQLVGPVVLGTAAHVHPVLIIFCFLAGGIVFGIPGIILAVPVALLIKSTLATLYGDEGE
jgi:predicted PurR-regulated permease PerM